MGRLKVGYGPERLEERELFSVNPPPGDTSTSQNNTYDNSTVSAGASGSTSGTPGPPDAAFWNRWIDQYVDRAALQVGGDATAELFLLAQRRMFLKASIQSRDVGRSLYELVTANPGTAYWSNSGTAVEFVQQAFADLGIASNVQIVNLWHQANDSHLALEYYSNVFDKFVYFEPLYGYVLLDQFGTPAGARDILNEIGQHGYSFQDWSYKWFKLDQSLSLSQLAPADTRFEYYENRDFSQILRYYFNVVAIQHDDSSVAPAKAKWLVYDNTAASVSLTKSEGANLVATLSTRYSTAGTGKYDFALYHLSDTNHLPNAAKSQVANSVVFDSFLTKLRSTSPSLPNSPSLLNDATLADRTPIERWISRYVPVEHPITSAEAPGLLFLAMRRMYLQATTDFTDIGGNFYDLLKTDPATAYWAYAGDSVDFVVRALSLFGVRANVVSLWHTMSDSHRGLEYFDPQFKKSVFYDPLYGVWLRDANGTPASIRDIQTEIARHGFNVAEWTYQPVKFNGEETAATQAGNASFQAYVSANYQKLLEPYFNVVAVRYEDYGSVNGLLPGEEEARGKWTVYNNSSMTSSPSQSAKDLLRNKFAETYSVEYRGRYYLDTYDVQDLGVRLPNIVSLEFAGTGNVPTNSDTLVFVASFSEPVRGLTAANFMAVGTTATVAAPTTTDGGLTWRVSVTGGDLANLNGKVRLDLVNSQGILDAAGNSIIAQTFTGPIVSVDNTRPALLVLESVNPLQGPTNSDTITVLATFSEPVVGMSASNFKVTDASLATVATSSRDGGRQWLVSLSGGNLADFNGDVHVDFINNNGVVDAAGNLLSTVSFSGPTYRLDNALPALISLKRAGATAAVSNASSLTFEATFSEPVSGLTAANFKVIGATATIGNPTSSDGGVKWTINISGGNLGEVNGAVQLEFTDNSTVKDGVGNLIAATKLASEPVMLDHSPPSLLTLNRFSPVEPTTNADTLAFVATFSETVTGITASNFAVVGSTATVRSVETTDSGLSWKITVSGGNLPTANGTVGLNLINNTAIKDAAGNALLTTNFTGPSYLLDNIGAALLTIDRSSPINAATSADVLVFVAKFSEPVKGLAASNLKVLGSTATVKSLNSSDGGLTWSIQVAGGDLSGFNGDVGLNLISNTAVSDAAGNALVTTSFTGSAYAVDNKAPTLLSLTVKLPETATTNADSLTFQATFSEPVKGVTAANFGVLGSTAKVTGVESLDGGRTWRITVAGGNLATYNGSVGLTLNNNIAITDAIGFQLATTKFTGAAYLVDNSAPTMVSLDRSGEVFEETNADELPYLLTFSERVSGLSSSNFSVTGSTATITTVQSSDGGLTWKVMVSGGDLVNLDGVVSIDLIANTDIVDAAGNLLATTAAPGALYIVENTLANRFQQFSDHLTSNELSDNSTRQQWQSWVERYVNPSLFSARTTAEMVIAAMRQMYLKATIHEADVGGNLFDLVLANPQTAYWANCGSSADFLIRVLNRFGIAARKVQLWHTLTDSHVSMEYYSEAFGKYVFYDALYGTFLLNEQGVPASVSEILGEISKHGSNYSRWSLRTYRTYEPLSSTPTIAADQRYEYYNSRNYGTMLKYYFNVVALAHNDYTAEGQLLPGEPIASGKWIVYENLEYSDLASVPDRGSILQALRTRYSALENGRYYMVEVVHRSTEPYLTASTAYTTDAFPNFVVALQAPQPATGDQTALNQWLNANLPESLPDDRASLPERIALATRAMFLRATVHEQDVSGNLYQLVLQNPGAAYWANSQSATDFMIRVFDAYGLSARPVHLFVNAQQEHTALEFHSITFQKDIFYDPLYGVIFISETGEPASFADLQNEIVRYGFDSSGWNYRPVKLSTGPYVSTQLAADARYQVFNSQSYQTIISDYFHLAAVANIDAAHVDEQSTESWLVYNGLASDPRLSASDQQTMLDAFFDKYSVRQHGTHELSLYETYWDS